MAPSPDRGRRRAVGRLDLAPTPNSEEPAILGLVLDGTSSMIRLHPSIPQLWALGAVTTGVTCGCLLATRVAEFPPRLLAALAFIVLTILVTTVRYVATRDILDPLIVFSGVLAFYFGVHTVWLSLQPSDYAPIPTPYADAVASSTALLGVAYLLLVTVFVLTGRRGPQQTAPTSGYSLQALWTVFAFGFAVNLYGITIGAFQKSGTVASTHNLLIVQTLGTTALVAFASSVVQHYRSRTFVSGVTAVTQGLALLAFALAIGHKSTIVAVLFVWLAARHYSHRHLRVISLLIAVAIFVFVLTPVIQSGRDPALLADRTAQQQVEITLATLPTRIWSLVEDPASGLAGFDIVNQRTNGSESLALAYSLTPSVYGYQYGSSLADVPLSLIPHQILAGKSSHDPTRAFSLNYAGVQDDGFRGLTVSPTVPGDLYVNFGFVGVLVGFALLGFVLRSLAQYLRSSDVLVSVPLYAILMLDLAVVEVATPGYSASALYGLAVVVLSVVALRRLSDSR